MSNPEIIAQGGFNSGRLYQRDGQKIYWWQLADGWLFFKDVSRMVHGYVKREGPLAVIGAPVVPGWLMHKYDHGAFENYRPGEANLEFSLRAPADFDFGPALNI
jgi:hypothetical protein